MKENKNSRIGKFFETLIYTILLTLPLISVFVRSIYVQSNPNAKDSYSQIESIDTTIGNYTTTGIEQNKFYYFDVDDDFVGLPSNSWVNVVSINILNPNTSVLPHSKMENVYQFSYYQNQNGIFMHFLLSGNEHIYYPLWNSSNVQVNTLQFYFESASTILSADYVYANFTRSVIFGSQNQLDNAFDYSISHIISIYGKGNINFVNWLGNLFFNNTNDLLYFNFVNLYLNYSLVVSVAYLLWFVLNWMIKFVKSLLNSFLPKGDN